MACVLSGCLSQVGLAPDSDAGSRRKTKTVLDCRSPLFQETFFLWENVAGFVRYSFVGWISFNITWVSEMNRFPVSSAVTDEEKKKRLLFTVWNRDGEIRYSSFMTIISDVIMIGFSIKHRGSSPMHIVNGLMDAYFTIV